MVSRNFFSSIFVAIGRVTRENNLIENLSCMWRCCSGEVRWKFLYRLRFAVARWSRRGGGYIFENPPLATINLATTAAFHSAIPPSSASSAAAGDPLNFFSNPLHDNGSSLGFFSLDTIGDDLQSPSTPTSMYNNNNNLSTAPSVTNANDNNRWAEQFFTSLKSATVQCRCGLCLPRKS